MRESRIVASLRDQMLDVRLGIITPEQWHERRDLAIAQGVNLGIYAAVWWSDELGFVTIPND